MKKYILTVVFLIPIVFGVIYFVGKLQKNTGTLVSRQATRLFDYSQIYTHSKLKNINSDSLIITQQRNGTVFVKGKKKKRMLNRYGMNCFVASLREKGVLSEICFFRKNYWHINDYNFVIDSFEEEPFVYIDINGPDSKEDLTYKKYVTLNDNQVQVNYINGKREVYYIDTLSYNSPQLPKNYLTNLLR